MSAWTFGAHARVGAVLATSLLYGTACTGPRDTAPSAAPAAARTTAAAAPVARAESTTVTVYKSPTCGCCQRWVDHMRANGFRVVVHDTADVAPVRAAHGVGEALASCHTALVGGYVVEGHVPAGDVQRVLRERPAIAGLAAPGMPMGSPGMEGPYPSERYQVLAFVRGGIARVFAQH